MASFKESGSIEYDASWLGILAAVEEDETGDPIGIRLFGADGVVFEAQHIADLVEQSAWLFGHGGIPQVQRISTDK